jgi:hypothetical protein
MARSPPDTSNPRMATKPEAPDVVIPDSSGGM